MRELIERFSYRFRVWQRERYGDYSPADPTAQNPLRFIAVVAVMAVILGVTGPVIFHRAFDIVAIINIFAALLFLAFYKLRSRWAWHLLVAWVPFTIVLHWILRLNGYARYQPRVHSLAAEIIGGFLQIAFLTAVLIWVLHIRDRYFRYTEDARR